MLGGLPDSLLPRARLALSPGRGKNHVAAGTAFTLWCRGMETLLHRKTKFCPLNQPLKGKVGVSSQHPLVLSSSESICRWPLMPSRGGGQSLRALSSAGQEPTEDKPQGPVPQAGTRNKPGRSVLTLLVLSHPTGACRTGLEMWLLSRRRQCLVRGGRGAAGTASFAFSFLSFHCKSK